jgi:hypothetical protein
VWVGRASVWHKLSPSSAAYIRERAFVSVEETWHVKFFSSPLCEVVSSTNRIRPLRIKQRDEWDHIDDSETGMHTNVIVDVHELYCSRSEKAWSVFADQRENGAIVIRIGMNIKQVLSDAI